MRVIPGTGSRHGKGANGWMTDFVRKDFPRQAENLILAEIEDKEGQEQFRVSVNDVCTHPSNKSENCGAIAGVELKIQGCY